MLRLATIATGAVILIIIANIAHAWTQTSGIILAGGSRLGISAGVHLVARSAHPTAHPVVGHWEGEIAS